MILIIDDDPSFRRSLLRALAQKGYDVGEAASAAAGREILEASAVDLVLLDNRLGDATGIDLLAWLRDADAAVDVILLTAYPDVRVAVDAMRRGACDFIVKPFELAELYAAVERVLETRRLRRDVRTLQREADRALGTSDLLGNSPAVVALRERIARVAAAHAPVLISGETGTGKELVARAVHRLSPRAAGPLVTVNCGALPDSLLESELFGHEKGAFTGATAARDGVFELASGGSLFLDEIGEMKPELQAGLLRIVEGLPFRRLGGRRERHVDVRVIAATNRDLRARVAAGAFRDDLFFRLDALPLAVPPLRERGDDVGLLARHFLQQVRPGLTLSPATARLLAAYPWPGNVRELRNVIERAAVLSDHTTIEPDDLPAEMRRHEPPPPPGLPGDDAPIVTLAAMEAAYVRDVVRRLGGNISEAARLLGVARNTVRARLAEPGADAPAT